MVRWVGVDHAAHIHLLISPTMTSRVDKNKMKMMTIVIKMLMIKMMFV